MIFAFEDFELDTAKVELRRAGEPVAVEPQVFALIRFLLANRDRMVAKDEIVAAVWDGRIVSDSAIASRVKSARQALGDDGRAQRLIRTAHGVGFRFVGEVREGAAPALVSAVREITATPEPAAARSVRPSIAVLPFRLVGAAGPLAGVAEALPDDLTTELARLRWLFVIARASAFQFAASADLDAVRAALNVRYCLTGAVEVRGEAITVLVELSDAEDRGVVWSDRFRATIGAVHDVRDEIVRAIVGALEFHIPLNEARLARLKPPDRLDAWQAYHLGLTHMYRFNKDDNSAATTLFERARTLEPEFARAHAGLSFTHWQSAFLGYAQDGAEARRLAHDFAAQALTRDPLDAFANFTMGRAFLLNGDLDASLPWLERATALSPNYAQAKYALSWVGAMRGEAKESRTYVDEALALSPLDPLLYAMMASRAFTHVVLGQGAEAAAWGERAARAPGAHRLIEMIAVVCHGMNGDEEKARSWAWSVRRRWPDASAENFFRAFPFREPATRRLISETLTRYGF